MYCIVYNVHRLGIGSFPERLLVMMISCNTIWHVPACMHAVALCTHIALPILRLAWSFMPTPPPPPQYTQLEVEAAVQAREKQIGEMAMLLRTMDERFKEQALVREGRAITVLIYYYYQYHCTY